MKLIITLLLTAQMFHLEHLAVAPDVIVMEAEQAAFHGGRVENSIKASGGKVLGDGWGGQSDHFADFTFELAAQQDCAAFMRYGYDREQFLRRYPNTRAPHALRISLDGREIARRLECPDTADWHIYANLRVPLGKVRAGKHLLRLIPDGNTNDMNLDKVTIVPPDYAADLRTAQTLPEGSKHFRIRLSPRVDPKLVPVPTVIDNLEKQYAFHSKFLGFAPERMGLLTIVAQDDWPDNGSSAWTSMGNVYLNEREIATPGNNYAHEMVHFFEEGLDYPTWWSEGVAYVISMRADKQLYGRSEKVDAWVARLHKWWDTEGKTLMVRDGKNVAQWWGSDKVPPDTRKGLYNTANLILYSLWEQEGDGFFQRFYALIREDIKAGRYRMSSVSFEEKNRLIMDYARRAAGMDLSSFWQKWGMPTTK
jgi:hypothetical protein